MRRLLAALAGFATASCIALTPVPAHASDGASVKCNAVESFTGKQAQVCMRVGWDRQADGSGMIVRAVRVWVNGGAGVVDGVFYEYVAVRKGTTGNAFFQDDVYVNKVGGEVDRVWNPDTRSTTNSFMDTSYRVDFEDGSFRYESIYNGFDSN